MNVYVAHEPVVLASVVVGLGVVTQLIPLASLLFVSVPGQHPNLAALHAGERVVLAAAVVVPAAAVVAAAFVAWFRTTKSKISARNISLWLF